MPRERDALRVRAQRDLLAAQDLLDGRGDVRVLARDEARLHLDDGDRGSEAPERLRQLEAHVGAAHHHQVLGQAVEREDRAVVEVRDLFHAGHSRHEGAPTHIDEDARRRQQVVAHAHLGGRFEDRLPAQHRAAGQAAQPALEVGTRGRHHGVGARLDAGHVHGDAALDHDAVVARAARQVRGPGAGHQRLRRRASGVDACPAEERPLDQGHLHAGAREPPRERRPRLTRADDDGVERRHGAAIPTDAAPPIAKVASPLI